jgi:hypothetical protein
MSLDQHVACRRSPKLPDDLPQTGKWSKTMFEGLPVFTFHGGEWLINVMADTEFPEDMKDALADDLADAGIAGAKPEDYPVYVSVSLEPVTMDADAIDLQMDVLDMLIETCDGVVMAN